MDIDPYSYCGLYCGACEIMALYRQCRESGRTARWEDLPEQLRRNIYQAEVKCHGCRSDTVFEGCRRCRIRGCARRRGVAVCAECPEFPCAQAKELRKSVSTIREKLPHTEAIFGNLESARMEGKDAWMGEQRKRWNCTYCGAPFTWYQERCTVCKRDLKECRGY